jgi:hypothetical protein
MLSASMPLWNQRYKIISYNDTLMSNIARTWRSGIMVVLVWERKLLVAVMLYASPILGVRSWHFAQPLRSHQGTPIDLMKLLDSVRGSQRRSRNTWMKNDAVYNQILVAFSCLERAFDSYYYVFTQTEYIQNRFTCVLFLYSWSQPTFVYDECDGRAS